MADFKTLLDNFGLSVVTWRNSKKGDRRGAAHRESIAAKQAVLQAYDGLRRLADEYDACIRHMDAGGDFHEFMAARAREFDTAQQAAAGTPGTQEVVRELVPCNAAGPASVWNVACGVHGPFPKEGALCICIPPGVMVDAPTYGEAVIRALEAGTAEAEEQQAAAAWLRGNATGVRVDGGDHA